MGNKREELRKKLMERVGFTPDQVEIVVEVMYENLKAAVKDKNNLAIEVEKVAPRAAMDAAMDTPKTAANKMWEEYGCNGPSSYTMWTDGLAI